MKNIYLILIVLLCACSRQEVVPTSTVCGTDNPVQNLPWLRQAIFDSSVDVVPIATYQGKTYINLYAYGWTCTTCRLYECSGTKVDYYKLSAADQQELSKLLFAPEAQIIYKRKQ